MSFVVGKGNTLGIGKLIERDEFSETIEYFDSPISTDRRQVVVPVGAATTIRLQPQTRVYFQDTTTGFWQVGRVDGHVDSSVYISLPNQETVIRAATDLYTRWDFPIKHPGDHLAAQVSETPFFHAARVDLVRHFVEQRAAAAGMTALLSAPIELEAHQVEVIRQVLQDPVQRYLLADEVGLGKTIEAGIIIRQHILDHPDMHRVLILVPVGLVEQWKMELAHRCHVDADRYGHRVEIVALEAFVGWDGETPDFIVVDEAHQAVHGWNESPENPARVLFEKLRRISAPARCPKLLLLSATPVRHNEDGFLALLHLLDPAMHPIDDTAGFRVRVAKRQELADLTAGFVDDQSPFFLESIAGQLAELFPADARLGRWLDAVRRQAASDAVFDEGALREAIRAVHLHLGETYRLHRRFLRNRRDEKLATLLPGRNRLRTADWNDPGIVRAEHLLEAWRTQASASSWDGSDPAWQQALAGVFQILLESAWGDCDALLLCVEARRSRRVQRTGTEKFGALTSPERMRLLTQTRLFEGEETILGEIVAHREAFREGQRERIKTWRGLVGRLRREQLRVVCMATSPALADQLCEGLRVEFGAAVRRHTPSGTAGSGDWAASKISILVCDGQAEEGLNLQGGKACLVHVDLPLSPNRLEQRIGRLDRFGAGTSVTSYALRMEECPFSSAWVDGLKHSWRVFERSIAALQYTVEDEMRALTDKMFLEGASAIRESAARLGGEKGTLEKEFVAIRNQDKLDALETPPGEDSAESLVARVEANDARALEFRRAVDNWFVQGLHFWQVVVSEPTPLAAQEPDKTICYHFHPPDARKGRRTQVSRRELLRWFMPFIDPKPQPGEVPPPLSHPVVYLRRTASHRATGLARLGHPVIDCLHEHLRWDDRGVSFAMWRPVLQPTSPESVRAWFRFDFIVEADPQAVTEVLQGHPALSRRAAVRRADAAFPPIIETVWLDQELLAPDAATLNELTPPYDRSVDKNVNQDLWPRALERLGLVRWSELCAEVLSAAENALREQHDLASRTRTSAEVFEAATALRREQGESRLSALPVGSPGWAGLRADLESAARIADAIARGIRQPRVRAGRGRRDFLGGRPAGMSFAELKMTLRDWPDAPVPGGPFADAPHERLRRALAVLRTNPERFGPSDLASLVRQTLRGETERHGGRHRLAVPAGGETWPDAARWKQHGCRVFPAARPGFVEIEAVLWEPEWLPGSMPFASVEAGERRRVDDLVPADPAVSRGFGFASYLSSAQAEAVRAVMLSPPDAVRLVILPTSAGKSLVGLAASLLGTAEAGGVSIIVVPTLALATDQVEKAQKLFPGTPIDAWKSGLDETARAGIIDRLKAGRQRVLFVAPESLVNVRLSEPLLELAGRGSLRAFVVDEAHLVGQWGTSFRPEFQSMSALWWALRDAALRVGTPFRTLLMTATLTRESYADLARFFGPAEALETVAAVSLRPEMRDLTFQSRCRDREEKTARVLETLRHAPRPAILYVTEVAEAEWWHRRCLQEGWRCTGLMHGRCDPGDRDRELARWNRDELDLMVATSAFGLGMDKADVRAVLHACVPETVDRFYQEIGRGGRDGHAAASVMIWEPADKRLAERMSLPMVISEELGFARWRAMWHHGRDDGEARLVDLRAMRPDVDWDGERNAGWNLKTLLLLVRAGVLELLYRPLPEVLPRQDETAEAFGERRRGVHAEAMAFCAVRLLQTNPLTADDWERQVGGPRQRSLEAAWENWGQMETLLNGKRSLPQIARELYRVPEADVLDVGLEARDTVLCPPRTVCHGLGLQLAKALAARGTEVLLVTYPVTGRSERAIFGEINELLREAVSQGIRELTLPAAWRAATRWPGAYPNPVPGLVPKARENFLLVRDLEEAEPPLCGRLAVPRLSLLPPTHADRPLPTRLLGLVRPCHLIVLPAECPDHHHPGRRVGDAGYPSAVRLEDLRRVLQP